MQPDKNGYPDVCRSVAAVLSPTQITQMDSIKLQANTLIDEISNLHTSSPRYEALARTALEEAVMWATKAICTPPVTTSG